MFSPAKFTFSRGNRHFALHNDARVKQFESVLLQGLPEESEKSISNWPGSINTVEHACGTNYEECLWGIYCLDIQGLSRRVLASRTEGWWCTSYETEHDSSNRKICAIDAPAHYPTFSRQERSNPWFRMMYSFWNWRTSMLKPKIRQQTRKTELFLHKMNCWTHWSLVTRVFIGLIAGEKERRRTKIHSWQKRPVTRTLEKFPLL